MISLVICNSKKNELDSMTEYSHYLAAMLSEEEWKFNLFSDTDKLDEYIQSEPVFDIVCIDLTLKNSISLAQVIRKINKHAYIILVATTQISPMEYMRPGILAGSLLIREYSTQQLKSVFDEAFRDYLGKFESDDEKEDMYVIDGREGRQLIPYSSIYYFEAREKKIVIGCAANELVCYDTIAALEKDLPDYFIRCHRSYIINFKKAIKYVASQSEIVMEKDIYIPVSRSYRADMKKIFTSGNRRVTTDKE